MRKLILLACVTAATACASPGTPPGGPIDKDAPVLLSVVPDTGRTRITPPAVIFHFNEVIAERPPGVTSLEQLFLISPRDGTPSVDWKRKDVTVRPARGFHANTTYVVSLLPGIADLRGNVRNTGAQTVFSTGPEITTRLISGMVWNWLSGIPAQKAYVEAIKLPDSSVYVTLTDSAGRFRIDHLPDGTFLIRGVVDDNRNRGIDPREAWDSASVVVGDSATVSLFAIARDSVVPLLGEISAEDSVTLRLRFERPLDPAQLPSAGEVTIQRADSSVIPVLSVSLPAADTTSAKQLSRPAPPLVILVRLAAPLRPGADYRVTISRVTGFANVSGRAVRTFRMPAPAAPTSAPPPVNR